MDAQSETAPAPQPEPMTLKRARRPYGRPRSEHLRIEADAVSCLTCLTVTPRDPAATTIEVVHEPNCKALKPAKLEAA